MAKVQTTLWIEEEHRAECQEKHWKYGDVFLCGMDQKRGMPKILERINELEAGNQKLQAALSRYWHHQGELQAEIDQLRAGTVPHE